MAGLSKRSPSKPVKRRDLGEPSRKQRMKAEIDRLLRKRFRRSLDNGLESVNQPSANSSCKFLTLPMDVILKVFDHIDPIDRTMVRYACKALYDVIPPTQYDPTKGGKCAKLRVALRLSQTDLFPRLPRRFSYMSREETLEDLFQQIECKVCPAYFGLRGICCPFHPELWSVPESTPPIIPLSDRARAFVSADEYVKAVKREISQDITPWAATACPASKFMRSWCATVENIYQANPKTGLIPGQRAGEIIPRSKTPTYANASSNPRVLDFVSLCFDCRRKYCDGECRNANINTVYCCSHCTHALPGNSYLNPCDQCDCQRCGWTSIRVLRVVRTFDNDIRYAPLGYFKPLAGNERIRQPAFEKSGARMVIPFVQHHQKW